MGGVPGRGFSIVERAAVSSRGNLLLQGNSYLKSTLRLLLRRRVWGQTCYLKTPLPKTPHSIFPMYTPARNYCELYSENIISCSWNEISKKIIPKTLFYVILWITYSFVIQRITWTGGLGIILLENLISVTWNSVFGINFAIISG